MSDGTEPCSCRFCLATEQVVSDAEPAWGGIATYLIARNMKEVDPEQTPTGVMTHLTSMKRQFFRSGQLDLRFAVDGISIKGARLIVSIYWRFAPLPMVKSAGKT